jgi:hypothetical protein
MDVSKVLKILNNIFMKIYKNITRKNIELFIISTYMSIKQYMATLNFDDGVLNSIYIGMTLGICVVTFLIMYPGEPTTDYSETSEQEALAAIKRKLYTENEEDQQHQNDGNSNNRKKKSKKGGKRKEKPKTQAEKEEEEELKALEQKINELEGKTTTSRVSTKNTISTKDLSSSSELIDKETLRRLEKFEEIKRNRQKETDAEADMFLNDLRKRGITKDKFKSMLPKDMDLDTIKKRGEKPWILSCINYIMPLGLVVLMVYIVQRDFEISVPYVLKSYFPREASVFENVFLGVRKFVNEVVDVE